MFTENLGRIGADAQVRGTSAATSTQPGESTQQEKTEQREIMLQKVRQRSSSKPWKGAGWWRAMHEPCASTKPRESLWITAAPAGTADPRIHPLWQRQQGCPSPGQVSLQCLISLLSHPSFLALLQAGTQEKGAEAGESRGKCSTGLGEPSC